MKDVLIVDDDDVFIFLGRKMLSHIGNIDRVYTSSNGREALELMQTLDRAPDIILLDLNMPVMDGFEFLDACKNGAIDPAKTRICIVSSSENPQDIKQATDLGANNFIFKPLEESSLRTCLQ